MLKKDSVIPVETGIQEKGWIPAFAGMTGTNRFSLTIRFSFRA
jgi:hypothetical protein